MWETGSIFLYQSFKFPHFAKDKYTVIVNHETLQQASDMVVYFLTTSVAKPERKSRRGCQLDVTSGFENFFIPASTLSCFSKNTWINFNSTDNFSYVHFKEMTSQGKIMFVGNLPHEMRNDLITCASHISTIDSDLQAAINETLILLNRPKFPPP